MFRHIVIERKKTQENQKSRSGWLSLGGQGGAVFGTHGGELLESCKYSNLLLEKGGSYTGVCFKLLFKLDIFSVRIS